MPAGGQLPANGPQSGGWVASRASTPIPGHGAAAASRWLLPKDSLAAAIAYFTAHWLRQTFSGGGFNLFFIYFLSAEPGWTNAAGTRAEAVIYLASGWMAARQRPSSQLRSQRAACFY